MFQTIYRLIFTVCAVIFLNYGCKTDDENSNALDPYNHTVPVLTTRNVVDISQNSAVSGGKISSDGGSSILSKGVCWSLVQYPRISDTHTNEGEGPSDFTSSINGLDVGTTYYVRSFATNNEGTGYGSQLTFTTPDSLFTGINYSGGIIFYLDSTKQHGLACALNDQAVASDWGCAGNFITGADGNMIGMGRQNTLDILVGCDSAGIAARICADLSLNGYSDWFLPSKDELAAMYTILKMHGKGNFSDAAYWSSSEMNSSFAWQVIFTNGIVQGVSKNNHNSVRAVRTF